jgi:hypothetical protein
MDSDENTTEFFENDSTDEAYEEQRPISGSSDKINVSARLSVKRAKTTRRSEPEVKEQTLYTAFIQ